MIPELRLLSAIIQASGAFMLTGFVFVESFFRGLIPLPPGPNFPPTLAGLVVKKPSGEMQKAVLKTAGGRPPCTPQGAALSQPDLASDASVTHSPQERRRPWDSARRQAAWPKAMLRLWLQGPASSLASLLPLFPPCRPFLTLSAFKCNPPMLCSKLACFSHFTLSRMLTVACLPLTGSHLTSFSIFRAH